MLLLCGDDVVLVVVLDVVLDVVINVVVVILVSICCCCVDIIEGDLVVVKWWFLRGKAVFPGHCSVLKMSITLSFLRLKLWGLMFWKAYDFSYKFDVLSFCIRATDIL